MTDTTLALTIDHIEEILDQRIRPALALHGGNIVISKLEDTTLYVQFTGQCSSCASADLTIETLVDSELKAAFSALTKVELVTGVSDSLMDEARRLLNRRHA